VLGLAVTILAVASIFASSLPFAVAWLGTPLVLTALAHYLFRNGSVAPTALWLAAWLTTFLAGLAARSLLAERRGHLFRHAVSVFVGESVARHMDVAGRMHLDSRREEVTVLFTDIEGFTAFSESREPEVVLQSLNLYFEQLNEIVQRHGGQVNKLIGDGMLALFAERPAEPGQPPPEPHALRATRAAIEIAKTESGFRTRAGLHTGMVVVGNVGSGVKLEYTALGDTVNVASRLEALNKERHTRILLSGATRDGIGNAIALLPAGEVAVRGKTTGLPVYTTEWPLE
jgi:adenylate cyclase